MASRQAPSLDWANSTQIGPDIPTAVDELRARHEHIHVIGGIDFVQTLFAGRLFDQLTLWVYPILVGDGKEVFADGAVPTSLRLVEPAISSPTGTVQLRYELAEGTPSVGDMSLVDD